jgi:hypothetical protein
MKRRLVPIKKPLKEEIVDVIQYEADRLTGKVLPSKTAYPVRDKSEVLTYDDEEVGLPAED